LRDASPHFIAAHDEITVFDLVAWWPAENAICPVA
jgi:hypothetical protein